MDLYVNLSYYIVGDLKNVLLFINPEEKKLVKDVIAYICDIYAISNTENPSLFKDEWFIYPNQSSEILKEKGILLLKPLAASCKNASIEVETIVKKKCKQKKKLKEKIANDLLIEQSYQSNREEDRPINCFPEDNEIRIKKKSKNKRSKKSLIEIPVVESESSYQNLLANIENPSCASSPKSFCDETEASNNNRNILLEDDLKTSKLHNKKKRTREISCNGEVTLNNEDKQDINSSEETKRKIKFSKQLHSPSPMFESNKPTNIYLGSVGSIECSSPFKSSDVEMTAVENVPIDEIDWNNPESYLKIKSKRKRKHNKAKKKLKGANDFIDTNSPVILHKEPEAKNLHIAELTLSKKSVSKQPLLTNEEDSNEFTDSIQMPEETNLPGYGDAAPTDNIRKPMRCSFFPMTSTSLNEDPVLKPHILTKFSNLLDLEKDGNVAVFDRYKPITGIEDTSKIEKSPIPSRILPIGPPEPSAFIPNKEIIGKLSTLTTLEKNSFLSVFCRKGFGSSTINNRNPLDTQYEGLPLSFGSGKSIIESTSFSFKTNEPAISFANVSRSNSTLTTSSSGGTTALQEVENSPEVEINSNCELKPIEENLSSIRINSPSESQLITDDNTVLSVGLVCQNSASLSDECLNGNEITPSFCGAPPAKKRNNRRYLSIGNVLKSLKNKQEAFVYDNLTSLENAAKQFAHQKNNFPNDHHENLTVKHIVDKIDLISKEIKQELIDSEIVPEDHNTKMDIFYRSCQLIPDLPTVGDIIVCKVMSIDELFCPCYSEYKAAKVLNINGLKVTLQFIDDCDYKSENGWTTKESFTEIKSNSTTIDWRDLKEVRLVSR